MRLSVSCHSRHTPISSKVTSLSVCTVPLEREGAAVVMTAYTDRVLPYILHTACKS